MEMTLLDMVQNIQSVLNGDEVNSIGDSVEALQIADEVRTAYYIMLQEYDHPFQKEPIKLESLADLDRPNYLRVPKNVSSLDWIRYNDTTDNENHWVEQTYLAPNDFVEYSLNLANNAHAEEFTELNGATLYCLNNEPPKYYTSFDEKNLVFNAYNSAVDDTLQSSKSLAYGLVVPDWRMEDTFVPKLRIDLYPRLLSEAKSAAFINIKQTNNPKEEQRSRRLITRHQNRDHRAKQAQSTSRIKNDYSRP